MDFKDSPAEAACREQARAWLDQHAPRHLDDALAQTSFGREIMAPADWLRESRAWQASKAAAGWACMQWPRAYGGRGASAAEQAIFAQEEGGYAALSGLFMIGHGMCGPTLLAHASEADKRRYLPPMVSGREIWCQLFSEPCAGSDLAGIRTRAERHDGAWRINGQKIWTSLAHLADYGLILVRTDPGQPKHQGLTMFYIDMHAAGVEARPIKQASGLAEFNEVFFRDLIVSDAQRLGPVNGGWTVALTTLMNERLAIPGVMPTGFDTVWRLAQDTGAEGRRPIEDALVRDRLADWFVRDNGLKYTRYRSLTALSRGEMPGPENSIGKLVTGGLMQEIASFMLDLEGIDGLLGGELAADGGRPQAMFLRSPATRIEGGSDEILRNIIGERVLGLPPDVRTDKDVPFQDIPQGR